MEYIQLRVLRCHELFSFLPKSTIQIFFVGEEDLAGTYEIFIATRLSAFKQFNTFHLTEKRETLKGESTIFFLTRIVINRYYWKIYRIIQNNLINKVVIIVRQEI